MIGLVIALAFWGLVVAGIILGCLKSPADGSGTLPKPIRKALGHWF